MAKASSITAEKEKVEQELLAKEQDIRQGVHTIQEEVANVAPSVQKAIFNHPLVSVGGALVAGVVVGLIFGRRKRTGDEGLGAGGDHRALVDQYVAAIMEETRHRVAAGEDVAGAVAHALKDRVPLIVYEAQEKGAQSGFLSHIVRLLARELLPLGLTLGKDWLAQIGAIEEPPALEHDEGST